MFYVFEQPRQLCQLVIDFGKNNFRASHCSKTLEITAPRDNQRVCESFNILCTRLVNEVLLVLPEIHVGVCYFEKSNTIHLSRMSPAMMEDGC